MRGSRRTLVWIVAGVTVILGAGCAPSDSTTPACDDPGGRANVLVAQSVPSATMLPCVQSLPAGWSVSGTTIRDSGTTLFLDSVLSGIHAVEVTLAETCDTSGASEIVASADEVGARVTVAPTSLDPYEGSRFIEFEGGCVTYLYEFSPGTPATVALEIDASLSFLPRDAVAHAVEVTTGATLCGAGAPPCVEGP